MQINSNVNVRDFPQLTKALEIFMEKNNIHKDSAVLEKFLSDYSLTLETPKEEKPIEKEEKPCPKCYMRKNNLKKVKINLTKRNYNVVYIPSQKM